MKSYTVSENATLKEFTDNHCAQASFCFRALLKAREIRVNGERVGRDVPLKAGDSVCYYMTAAQQSKKAFTELYRDENVIVLDKESGVLRACGRRGVLFRAPSRSEHGGGHDLRPQREK